MKKVLFLILCILIFNRSILADQQKEYSSYPIIFVHGYNAQELPPESGWDRWKEAKKNIEKYFYENGEYKYSGLDTKEKYFPTVNYGYQKTGLISKNGDIPTIAEKILLPKVKWALDNCFPVHYSESERKIIIVTHSMGGLVVRSFLTQFPEYQNKIDKVVFVDVPHLGSPYASAVWMIDKEAKEILPPLIRKYSTFFSKTVGTLKFFNPALGVGAENIFNHISFNLQDRLRRDSVFLWSIENIAGTDPDGYAIDKMRLPFNSEYHDKVEGWYGLKYISVPIDITDTIYKPSETFLGSTNLAIPSNFKIISGKVPSNFGEKGYLGYKAFEYITGILFSYRERTPLDFLGFSFEPGYTLEDVKTTGDGVVPKLSQETVGDKVGADYPIITTHSLAPNNWQTVLQAIDDKPIIESVRFASTSKGEELYVIFKVKDYLLADIEISDIRLGNILYLSDLTEFRDSKTGKYKPYVKFKKDFLKERDDEALVIDKGGNTTYLHLYPGEFYIKVNSLDGGGYIKIKNAAQRETGCNILEVGAGGMETFRMIKRQGMAHSNAPFTDPNRIYSDYSEVRERAYDNFRSANKYITPYSTYGYGVGLYGQGSISQYYGYYFCNAAIEMIYGICRSLTTIYIEDNKKIKSVALYVSGYKIPERQGLVTILGPDFNVKFFRDSSNTWPPTLEPHGDILMFSLNTSAYKNGGAFIFELDPNDIDPKGNNVFKIIPDLLEYNCIPGSLLVNERKCYSQEAAFGLSLIIVY